MRAEISYIASSDSKVIKGFGGIVLSEASRSSPAAHTLVLEETSVSMVLSHLKLLLDQFKVLGGSFLVLSIALLV